MKFFILIQLIARVMVVTGKNLDDLEWEDLLLILSDEESMSLIMELFDLEEE